MSKPIDLLVKKLDEYRLNVSTYQTNIEDHEAQIFELQICLDNCLSDIVELENAIRRLNTVTVKVKKE